MINSGTAFNHTISSLTSWRDIPVQVSLSLSIPPKNPAVQEKVEQGEESRGEHEVLNEARQREYGKPRYKS